MRRASFYISIIFDFLAIILLAIPRVLGRAGPFADYLFPLEMFFLFFSSVLNIGYLIAYRKLSPELKAEERGMKIIAITMLIIRTLSIIALIVAVIILFWLITSSTNYS